MDAAVLGPIDGHPVVDLQHHPAMLWIDEVQLTRATLGELESAALPTLCSIRRTKHRHRGWRGCRVRNNMWGDCDPGMRHVEEVHCSICPPGETWRADVAPVRAAIRGNQDGIVDLCAVLARRSDRPAPKRGHHLERSSGVDRA